jgi:hypothetical protein
MDNPRSPRRLSGQASSPTSGSPPGAAIVGVSSSLPVLQPPASSNLMAPSSSVVSRRRESVPAVKGDGDALNLVMGAASAKGHWKTFSDEEIAASFQPMPLTEVTLDASLEEVVRALMQPEFWNDSDAKNNSTRVSMVEIFV